MIRLVDSNSGTTVWAFDTLDRAVSETYQDGSIKKFSFDYANDVVEYTDCNGSVFTNTWDCMGRKTNVVISPASGLGGTYEQTFQYDGLSRVARGRDFTASESVWTWNYFDSVSRVVEEAQLTPGAERYTTSTQFTSLPVTQFEYPNNRLVASEFDALYRRSQIIEQATGAAIADWQYFGQRQATVTLGNGLVCSNMNNAQNRSAIQSGLPTPAWGNITTDQLGYDGAGRMIGKRYFNGGNVLVGFTSAYDMSSNKFFERPLHAEERSCLYDSYDSMNRLLDYQRGVLASGGGSVYHHGVPFPNNNNTRNVNPRRHFQAGGSDIFAPPDFVPLPVDSPKCDTYPKCYTYVGANARCFCRCAGNSPWSQYVRACLVGLYKEGASATLAHASCYFWAEVKFGLFSAPGGMLANCHSKCSQTSVPLMPPPVGQPTMFFNMV